jgi:hypothetical protein
MKNAIAKAKATANNKQDIIGTQQHRRKLNQTVWQGPNNMPPA